MTKVLGELFAHSPRFSVFMISLLVLCLMVAQVGSLMIQHGGHARCKPRTAAASPRKLSSLGLLPPECANLISDSIQMLHTSMAAAHWQAPVLMDLVTRHPLSVNFAEQSQLLLAEGNVFSNSFSSFQELIQGSVVSLHTFLTAQGVTNAYGPSIILFTVFVRAVLFPLNYKQIESTQTTQALNPKVQEIKEKYADNKEMQNKMVAMLYQETKINPLAGCLPALLQIPVFLALYRSFFNLAAGQELNEAFLWFPSLQGPVFGSRTTDWLYKGWHEGVPMLGWHDTLAYLSIPVLLYVAQAVSLQVLTPPSDDPAVQKSQRFLKYLPLLIAYFSLSVPAGLGIYWITNNILSTATTAGIKAYLKANPKQVAGIDLNALSNLVDPSAASSLSAWGFTSEEQIIQDEYTYYRPPRTPRIPVDFQ